MNKLLKLPLFLGVCGTACAGILAGVNALTEKTIENNAKIKQYNTITELFESYGSLKIDDSLVISNELEDAGVTTKIKITATGLEAIAYSATTPLSGYGGSITFQAVFKDGQIYAFKAGAHKETAGFGKDFINAIESNPSNYINVSSSYNFDGKAGATLTSNALRDTINAIVADYAKGL